MRKNELLYALMEPAVDRAMRSLNKEPRRTLRNLVNTGSHMTKDPQIRGLLKDLHDALEQDDSAFFPLAQRVNQEVNAKSLKTLGFNLVCNSWHSGGALVRKQAKSWGCGAPWAMLTDLRYTATPPLALSELDGWVRQGESLGIYTFVFRCGRDPQTLKALAALVSRHRDSVFLLACSPEAVRPENAEAISKCCNAAVALDLGDGGAWSQVEEAAGHLWSKSVLFGGFCLYDDTSPWPLDPQRLLRVSTDARLAFVAIAKQRSCTDDCVEPMSIAFSQARRNGQYPIVPINLDIDLPRLARYLSPLTYVLKVQANGQVRLPCREDTFSLREDKLVDILRSRANVPTP